MPTFSSEAPQLELLMKNQTKTWNLKLMATDERPETTIEGIGHEDAVKMIRALMYGPASSEYAQVEAAARASHVQQPIAA
jgi:hypothetical protein